MSLKKQTLWSIAPLLVVTVINIVSVPLFYRYLGPEMYALWFYVLSLSGAFGFADLGLGVAVGRYVGVELGRGDVEAARSYWGTANVVAIPLLITMALAFVLLGTILGPIWFNVRPDQVVTLKWSFVAAGVGFFFAFYCQFWNILAQVNLDFKFLSILGVSVSIVQVTGSLILAFYTGSALVLLVWSSTLGIAQLAILIFHASRRYRFGLHWQLAKFARVAEMAGYTTKTFLTLIVNSVFGGIDRLALGKLATPLQFANYSVCSNVGARISGLSVAIMGPIFSHSSRAVGAASEKRVAEIYEESFDFVFGWLVLLAIWLIVWKRAILHLWLGPNLGAQVEPLLPPIIVAYCLTALANVSGAQLGPLNRLGIGLSIHILAGALVAICVYLGWQWGGLVGVAYGFLVSRLALLLQDFFVIHLTKARGWLDPARWLYSCAQVLIGGAFWLLILLTHPTVPVQLGLALIHGGVIAAWLIRKDLATWSSFVPAQGAERQ